MREIRLVSGLCDGGVEALAGTRLAADAVRLSVDEDAAVYRPDGSLLLRLCRGALDPAACRAAWSELRRAERWLPGSDNRAAASGGAYRRRPLAGGGLARTEESLLPPRSGVLGYYERTARFPYCRPTRFTRDYPLAWARVLPWVRAVDAVFAAAAPDRYRAQRAFVDAVSPDFRIAGTAFTTLTVNRNYATAVHADRGDLKAGLGVLSVFRAGTYRGCQLVWPKWHVGVELRTGDVLLADVHEYHGNTPLCGLPGTFERLSVVLYVRERLADCGTAAQELARARRRRRGSRAAPGDPLHGRVDDDDPDS